MKKIAVPSNDGIHIAEDFGTSKNFLIFEAGDGFISNEEIRRNPADLNSSKTINDEERNSLVFNKLCDCEIIICQKINIDLLNKFKSIGLQILKTLESNARKGIINMVCR